MKIVLDSSVAGFLIQATPAIVHRKAHAYARRMVTEPDHDYLLPAPVLAEILAAVDAARRDECHALLEQFQNVRLIPFDSRAARIAADLTVKGRGSGPWQHVKVDAQIVASAFRFRADAVCALDGDHARLAEHGPTAILVAGPERFVRQVPLFQPPE